MFTGIVQGVGTVASLKKRGAGARIEIAGSSAATRGLGVGASVAVNGCCLTIIAKGAGRFAADLTAETLARTALGGYRRGDRVNLEAPLRAGDPLSGHMLQGHVEAVGRLTGITPAGEGGGWTMTIGVPASITRYLIPKGSLAVDGISLTIAAILDGRGPQPGRAKAGCAADWPGAVPGAAPRGRIASFAIIPHTYHHTHLGHLQAGAAMNLETDPIARHLERLWEARSWPERTTGTKKTMTGTKLAVRELRRQGF